jgi:hypothetical protein
MIAYINAGLLVAATFTVGLYWGSLLGLIRKGIVR